MIGLLDMLPQYLGLKCEYSLEHVVCNLFEYYREREAALRGYNFNTHAFVYLDKKAENGFYELINVLQELNYSCVVCGEEYDCMPSMETYMRHNTSHC